MPTGKGDKIVEVYHAGGLVSTNNRFPVDAALTGTINLTPSGLALETSLQALLAELQDKFESGQEVALTAATLAALESITATIAGSVVVTDGGATLSIDDGGGSVTVDGTVAISNAFALEATLQSVLTELQQKLEAGESIELGAVTLAALESITATISGTVTVADGGGSLTVDGTVAVSNFPATQPVSGTVSVTEPVSVDDNGGSLTVDGPLTDAELRASPVPISGTITADFQGDTTDLDSGAGTDAHEVIAIGLPASGGHVVGGTSTNPIRTDPTGTTIQPVSGTVTATGPLTDAQLRATPVPVDVSDTTFASTVADGADVTQGAIADAAVVTDTTGTLSGKLRGLVKWAFERMPASLGQKLMAASFPVTIASDQSAVVVSATNLDVRDLSSASDSVTVTGTVAATLSEPISVDDNGSSLTVDDGGSSLTVDGTVAVSSVGGTVTVQDGGNVLSVDDGGSSLTVDGTVEIGATSLAALETTELGATTLAALETISITQPTSTADNDVDITVDATAGGVTLKAANAARTGAIIQNTGLANMRVTLDGSTPSATNGLQVVPTGSIRLSMPHCPTAIIKAIREGGTSTTASVVELT